MTDAQHNSREVEDNPTRPGWLVEEWKPTRRISILWNVLGILLAIPGFITFGVLATIITDEAVELRGLGGPLTIVVILIGTLVVHELIHGAAMLSFGARPQFGMALIHRVMPVAYCTSPGHWFTRDQFIVVALAPLVLMSLLGVLLMPFGDLAGWLVLPLAINAGGAIGDIWFFGMLLRRQSSTMVEDLRDGIRLHHPTEQPR